MYASFSINLSLLVFIFVTSLIVFPLLVRGWASNSKYSLIGCLRSIAQSISYEAVFSTLLILIFIIFSSYRVSSVASMKFLSLLVLLPIWVFRVLAECHRAPFDFSESESELVSGFNTEYMGGLFAFIFLSEYCSLLVSCSIIAYVFGGFILNGLISYVLLVLVIRFVFIVIRVTFSRFRYDKLIILAWKSLLPSTLFLLLAGFMLI
jgi:NADH-ubiquinone oxidoreductase chain 1